MSLFHQFISYRRLPSSTTVHVLSHFRVSFRPSGPESTSRVSRLQMPKVSVILPTHNRAHLLVRAIKSALSQTFGDFELLVIDDCSTDNTREIVAGFDDLRLRYQRHSLNGGAGVARNTGIRAASGEYIAFLDSDDEWLPGKLREHIRTFTVTNLQNVGLTYTGSLTVVKGRSGTPRLAIHRGDVFRKVLISNIIGGASTVMVRREVLAVVGGFDASLPASEDFELWIRIAECYQVDCIPKPLVRIHQSASRPRLSTNYPALQQARERIFSKHRKRYMITGLEHDRALMIGHGYHFRESNASLARRWYLRAAKGSPRNFKAYLRIVSTYLPVAVLRPLIAVLRLMRTLRSLPVRTARPL